MPIVTVELIESKLRQWQAGQLTAAAVHEWAESVYAVGAWESECEAANEVLGQLDKLDMDLVIPDDIPALLRALRSDNAGAVIGEHFDRVDYGRRRSQLSDIPMYSRFCTSAPDV